jgi:hypothetical protein
MNVQRGAAPARRQVAGQDLRGFPGAWLYGTATPPMPGHPDWTVSPVPAAGTRHN